MKPLTRRSVIAGSAAAVTALPALALPVAATEGGELAALVRRYFEETTYFNATGHDESDEQRNALADATFGKTAREVVGVPVRTREDALAAMEFLEREDCIENWEPAEALFDAIRSYLEGRQA